MADIFLKILNMSISAGWIVLIVIALRFLLKRAPKWINCILWGIIGIRLVMPFSFESVLSLIPSNQTISQTPNTPRPQLDSGLTIVDTPVNDYLAEHYYEGVTAPTGNFINLTTVISIIWLIGIVILITYVILSFLKLKSKIQTSVLLSDNVYVSENISSPFVLGIIKPKIYLSYNLSPEQTEHVIAHERAHIKRGDHIWKPLGFLILTVYWFNPLMWVGYILFCRDIELACDEKVIKKLDNNKKADYSQALLSCSVSRPRIIAACPLAFGEVSIKKRIKSVINYKKPTLWIIIVAIITSIAIAVCFLTNPITEALPETKGKEYEDTLMFNKITNTYNLYYLQYTNYRPDVKDMFKKIALPEDEEAVRDSINNDFYICLKCKELGIYVSEKKTKSILKSDFELIKKEENRSHYTAFSKSLKEHGISEEDFLKLAVFPLYNKNNRAILMNYFSNNFYNSQLGTSLETQFEEYVSSLLPKDTDANALFPLVTDYSSHSPAKDPMTIDEISTIFKPLAEKAFEINEGILNNGFSYDARTTLDTDPSYCLLQDRRFGTVADVIKYVRTVYDENTINRIFSKELSIGNDNSRFIEKYGKLYYNTKGQEHCFIADFDSVKIIEQYEDAVILSMNYKGFDGVYKPCVYIMIKTLNGWRIANSEAEARLVLTAKLGQNSENSPSVTISPIVSRADIISLMNGVTENSENYNNAFDAYVDFLNGNSTAIDGDSRHFLRDYKIYDYERVNFSVRNVTGDATPELHVILQNYYVFTYKNGAIFLLYSSDSAVTNSTYYVLPTNALLSVSIKDTSTKYEFVFLNHNGVFNNITFTDPGTVQSAAWIFNGETYRENTWRTLTRYYFTLAENKEKLSWISFVL